MARGAQTQAIPNSLAYPVAQQTAVQTLAASGAITIPGGIVHITLAGVAAVTLADPTVDGMKLIIYSTTAQAHTVTLISGLRGAGAGADVGTFGGAIADQVHLHSYGGYWWDSYNLNVTFA